MKIKSTHLKHDSLQLDKNKLDLIEKLFKRIYFSVFYDKEVKIFNVFPVVVFDSAHKISNLDLLYDPKLNKKYRDEKDKLEEIPSKDEIEELINKYKKIKLVKIKDKCIYIKVDCLDCFKEFLEEYQILFLENVYNKLTIFLDVLEQYREWQFDKFAQEYKRIELIKRR